MQLSEIFNKIFNKSEQLCVVVNRSIWSFLLTLKCALTGIVVGKKNQFYGHSKLMRASASAIEIGDRCRFRSTATSNLIGINHKCIITTQLAGAKLKIGNNCGFSGTTIGCFKEITIGDNVNFGANTLITDSDWHPADPRSGEAKAVSIGNNVWLGYGVIVLKGVSIGDNSLIGAGSIVTTNIPANVIAAGNPCKIIKEISQQE